MEPPKNNRFHRRWKTMPTYRFSTRARPCPHFDHQRQTLPFRRLPKATSNARKSLWVKRISRPSPLSNARLRPLQILHGPNLAVHETRRFHRKWRGWNEGHPPSRNCPDNPSGMQTATFACPSTDPAPEAIRFHHPVHEG